jgi:hypothetical protein
MTVSLNPMRNSILNALPAEDFSLLAPHLSPVMIEKGRLLYDPGDSIETVYFPSGCVISLMTLMDTGAAIESATIGREGALGLGAAIAPRLSLSRAIVQISGHASCIASGPLQDAYARSAQLRSLINRHTDALYGHSIQSVACNALHSVEARFCRWLLTCHDRIDNDTVGLTQEFFGRNAGRAAHHGHRRRRRPAGPGTDPLSPRGGRYPRPARARGDELRMLRHGAATVRAAVSGGGGGLGFA